jgi:hypothetical protein
MPLMRAFAYRCFLKKTKQKTVSPFLLFQVKNNILKDTFLKNTNYRIKSVFIFEIFLKIYLNDNSLD